VKTIINIVIIMGFISKQIQKGGGTMKKLLRRIFVFALIALPFVISTVGNITIWPGKSGK
jgi:hypothetical protein